VIISNRLSRNKKATQWILISQSTHYQQ